MIARKLLALAALALCAPVSAQTTTQDSPTWCVQTVAGATVGPCTGTVTSPTTARREMERQAQELRKHNRISAEQLAAELKRLSISAPASMDEGRFTLRGSGGEVRATFKRLPPAPALPSTKLGINLAGPDFSGTSRPFSNLILSSYWGLQTSTGAPPSAFLNANGDLIRAGAGDNVAISVPRPNDYFRGKPVDILCRWDGRATVRVFNNGATASSAVTANEARFTYLPGGPMAMLLVPSVPDPANPLRNLDCREASADRAAVFDPDYLALLKRFSVLRFMDWQLTNSNKPVTWATRSRIIGQNYVRGQDGYPVETMIALANAADTDPWFTVPWNADADYVRKFAQMVKADLKPGRKVYVELSNEVWNWYFLAAQQASREGVERGLSKDVGLAQYYRYAEKHAEVMDVWSEVFAGQPDRLVRVISFQAANPDGIKTLLGYRNTASKVDAVASAPYLDYDLDANPGLTASNLAPVFDTLRTRIDEHRVNQAKIRATAAQYGKQVLAYEGGQHVTGQNVDLQNAIQRDPRMQDVYAAYLRAWQDGGGGLMVLFNDVMGTTRYGAWGMIEHAGQSIGDTPKGRAVAAFQATISK